MFCNGYYWNFENSVLAKVVTTGISKHGYIRNAFKSLECIKDDNVLQSLIVKMNDMYIDQLCYVYEKEVIFETDKYMFCSSELVNFPIPFRTLRKLLRI